MTKEIVDGVKDGNGVVRPISFDYRQMTDNQVMAELTRINLVVSERNLWGRSSRSPSANNSLKNNGK
ncbi:MAG: hypothetical protein COX79_00720 [Candidatus Levybacteria bacterium CG_4_10_14_0_2_um_filter_36_16]|nr:MAG: hypothetical protein AUK12_02005 [Candidatus Levybacteria bacterium CG2_30_37_29]PIZ97844.1 MAG: hypothetical protein COX79_00720 [Candidatus Levybacteria bacterium CG_4_10_14_0_2_um_filter_36_16]